MTVTRQSHHIYKGIPFKIKILNMTVRRQSHIYKGIPFKKDRYAVRCVVRCAVRYTLRCALIFRIVKNSLKNENFKCDSHATVTAHL